MAIKVSKGVIANSNWKNKRNTKYTIIYERLDKIKIGEVVNIVLSKANISFRSTLSLFIKRTNRPYSINITRIGVNSRLWEIRKIKKRRK